MNKPPSRRGRSWGESSTASSDPPKREKFDFETMKEAAANENPAIRKEAFIEYFERFGEFPSYLFDNEQKIDDRLSETIQDLLRDDTIPKEMQAGIEALLNRLSF